MKKILLFSIVLFTISVTAQRKPKIKGSRVVTQVSETLPDFNTIVLEDDLDVVLRKSSGPGYDIEADDNLIDILKFKVEDSTLVISSFYKVTAKKKLDVTVSFTELNAITVKKGKMSCSGVISNETFFVDVYGNSKMDIKVDAGVMDLNLNESGSGDFNLDVDSLNVTMRGKSGALVYAVSASEKIELGDNANLKLEGTTDVLRANLSSNAKLRAQEQNATSVELKLQESPVARVNAFEEIKLTSNGNSKTFLYGNPKIIIEDFLDTSQLIKRKK